MLVSEKHHTVRPVFRRVAGTRRLYNVHESQDSIFGSSNIRNHVEIHRRDNENSIALKLNEARRNRYTHVKFSISFYGGSHRKLINDHDDNRISSAGIAFASIANRIRRINIIEPNIQITPSPEQMHLVPLLSSYLPEARRRLNNNNIEALEFIQLRCQNTLIELSVPAFDSQMRWSIDRVDTIRRHGNAINKFTQLKALDISCFECNHWCFEVFLREILGNLKGLEAIDISQNSINIASGNIIRNTLINDKLLRLDMNYIRARVPPLHLELSAIAAGATRLVTHGLPYESLPILSIIDGCCASRTLGTVKMVYTSGYQALWGLTDYVINKFDTGELRLFEFEFGCDELTIEQEAKILRYRERNLERWTICKQLQANEVSMHDMYNVISRISWDTSIITDAMRNDNNRIQFFVVHNKKEMSTANELPKRRTRTSVRAWKSSFHAT
jgi:hypothetical protein